MKVEEILEKFNIKGSLINVEEKESGHVHETYVATYLENNMDRKRYLLQKINTYAFPNPEAIMQNIESITRYLQNEMIRNENTNHKTLEIIETKEEKNLYISNENGEKLYYRMYKYIENSISYDKTTDEKIIYNIGKAFGNFQKMLREFPINTLNDCGKDFHNTKKRLESFLESIKIDTRDRAKLVENEINFILGKKDKCSIIVDKLEQKEIPLRVTHNDTKINNVMLDEKTNEFLGVVDLDTIMKGSILYDYGDGVRSATAKTLNGKQILDTKLFEIYTNRFLK